MRLGTRTRRGTLNYCKYMKVGIDDDRTATTRINER